MKIAIAFDPANFQRIHDEAEERGASISEHVDWLVKRCWALEKRLDRIDEAEKRQRQALTELEKKSMMKIRRAAWEQR